MWSRPDIVVTRTVSWWVGPPPAISRWVGTERKGGFQNMALEGPDGKTYTFSLRPLLPDESD